MHPHVGAVLGMLTALASTGLAAQKEPSACSLLTSAEISAAVGAKPGEPRKSDMAISSGPAKGQTMGGCMWSVGDQGMVSVSVMRALKGAQREEGLANIREAFDALKAQHWTEEKQEFSNGACSVMTPPPSAQDAPRVTGCMAEAKGTALSVSYMGSKQKLALDKAKALLDKAIGHLE